jgi:hypothetical protein
MGKSTAIIKELVGQRPPSAQTLLARVKRRDLLFEGYLSAPLADDEERQLNEDFEIITQRVATSAANVVVDQAGSAAAEATVPSILRLTATARMRSMLPEVQISSQTNSKQMHVIVVASESAGNS